MMKLDIQFFGGRGASSSMASGNTNAQGIKFDEVSKVIANNMMSRGQISEKDEEHLVNQLQKSSFDSLKKYAQHLESQYDSLSGNAQFSNEIMQDVTSKAMKKKNPNRYSVEYGDWRKS